MAIKHVECLVCHQKLSFKDDNTQVLIEHLNTKHNEKAIFRYLSNVPSQHGLPAKSGKKWNPQQTVPCQFCRKEMKPVLKRDAQNTTILSNLFWCFPCLKKRANLMNVHCLSCKKRIGVYNVTDGAYTPVQN